LRGADAVGDWVGSVNQGLTWLQIKPGPLDPNRTATVSLAEMVTGVPPLAVVHGGGLPE